MRLACLSSAGLYQASSHSSACRFPVCILVSMEDASTTRPKFFLPEVRDVTTWLLPDLDPDDMWMAIQRSYCTSYAASQHPGIAQTLSLLQGDIVHSFAGTRLYPISLRDACHPQTFYSRSFGRRKSRENRHPGRKLNKIRSLLLPP